MQYAYVVYSLNMECGGEGDLLVGVPLGGQEVIAVAGLELGGYAALAFVYGDAADAVKVAQDVVTGNGMAGLADVIVGDILLIEDEGFLLVYLQGSDIDFGGGVLVFVGTFLEEGDVTAPAFFIGQFVQDGGLVAVTQVDALLAYGCQ